jgi:hypothetical protein
MQATVWANREDFDAALEAAHNMDTVGALPGLASPIGAALAGRLDDAWDHIETTLNEAWRKGRGLAQTAVEETTAKVEQIIGGAGAAADALHEKLLARLHAYLDRFIDRAIARVRDSITITGHEMKLTSVELSQTVTLSGALKVSIQEACALTAEGQLVVAASYAASPDA